MRNFWKRTNRGLLLAGVTFILVGGYVITDYMMFAGQKAVIEDTLNAYADAIGDAIISSSNSQLPRSEWSEADVQNYVDTLSDVIRQYWTDTYDGTDSWVILKSDFLTEIREEFTDAPDGYEGSVTSYDCNLTQLQIAKNGPGAAMFIATLNVAATATGNAFIPSAAGTFPALLRASETDELLSSNEPLFASAEFYFTGELLQENGTWKISYMDGYLHHASASPAGGKGGNDGSSN